MGLASSAAPRIRKGLSGTPTVLDSSAPVTVNTNVWVWIKLRVNGTSIKSKAWLDGGTEPATWTTDNTDSDVSAAGWVGIFSFSSVGDPYDIGYFAVATNGDVVSTGASGGFFLGADF
jgi:hypothetical protein